MLLPCLPCPSPLDLLSAFLSLQSSLLSLLLPSVSLRTEHCVGKGNAMVLSERNGYEVTSVTMNRNILDDAGRPFEPATPDEFFQRGEEAFSVSGGANSIHQGSSDGA